MATPKAQWVTAVHQDGKDPKYITACQTYKTVITQELENASLKWRYYVGASGSGTSSYAPDVTWITPSNQDSDHAGNGFTVNRYGPDWVTAVVNAIGKSNYWKRSVHLTVRLACQRPGERQDLESWRDAATLRDDLSLSKRLQLQRTGTARRRVNFD
ncbi:MAG: hypothetical protein WBE30_10750 [Candidatus Cybelea sp.]